MIKKLLIALFLCLFAFKASAWNPMIVTSGTDAPALTCTDGSGDSSLDAYATGTDQSAAFTATTWRAVNFTLAATTRITKYYVRMQDRTTYDQGNIICDLRNTTTGEPTTAIGSTAVSVATTTMANATSIDVKFLLAAPVEVSAGTYAIACRGDGTNGDIFVIDGDSGDATSASYSTTDSGANWSLVETSDSRFAVWGCQ